MLGEYGKPFCNNCGQEYPEGDPDNEPYTCGPCSRGIDALQAHLEQQRQKPVVKLDLTPYCDQCGGPWDPTDPRTTAHACADCSDDFRSCGLLPPLQ